MPRKITEYMRFSENINRNLLSSNEDFKEEQSTFCPYTILLISLLKNDSFILVQFYL